MTGVDSILRLISTAWVFPLTAFLTGLAPLRQRFPTHFASRPQNGPKNSNTGETSQSGLNVRVGVDSRCGPRVGRTGGHQLAPFLQKFPLILLFSTFTFLTFILREKLQFISVTYLWSDGVGEKGQSGLELADPTATPSPSPRPQCFFSRDPWVENRCSKGRPGWKSTCSRYYMSNLPLTSRVFYYSVKWKGKGVSKGTRPTRLKLYLFLLAPKTGLQRAGMKIELDEINVFNYPRSG